MSGIAGIVDYSGAKPDERVLSQMIGLLHHRGTDASGIYKDEAVGLAHARLSIIDLAGGGPSTTRANPFGSSSMVKSSITPNSWKP